jgi:hypothetical protein
VILDGAAVRSAIMMGPNAHHVAPSMLAAEIAPMKVTFDVAILLARTQQKMPCPHQRFSSFLLTSTRRIVIEICSRSNVSELSFRTELSIAPSDYELSAHP